MIRTALKMMSVLGLGVCAALPAPAGGAEIMDYEGEALEIVLVWDRPVDLDVFLTDPAGETVYFANRTGRNGTQMGLESGCDTAAQGAGLYRETVQILKAQPGRYRVSVDFIKDCGNSTADAEFDVILKNKKGAEIDRARSRVQYRLLNPVAWEIWIQ